MKEITLKAFRKANKQAREKIASNRGFNNAAEMETSLLNPPKVNIKKLGKSRRGNETKAKPFVAFPQAIPVIHNVHILDASGSMGGDKIYNAVKGINSEIKVLKKDSSIEYTQTIVDFSDSNDIKIRHYKTPIREIKSYFCEDRGMTALNQAVGETLTNLLKEANGTDKYLIKIFTDGGENASRGDWRNGAKVGKLIKECEAKGFTVTFVGTAQDVKTTQQVFSIDASNTLIHDNTGQGVADSFSMTLNATRSYASKVLKGEDVSTNFYSKKIGTLD